MKTIGKKEIEFIIDKSENPNKYKKIKLRELLNDSKIAIATVREIKDADVTKFSSGARTRFVKYEWFKAVVENLL